VVSQSNAAFLIDQLQQQLFDELVQVINLLEFAP
jgi:hypothetical protein